MNRRGFFVGAAGWLLAGCGSQGRAVLGSTTSKSPGSTHSGSTPPPFHFGRIVSLTPSLTETIFALGAGSRVVGVCRADDYPAEVRELPVVSDMAVNWEKLLTLNPDCVVVDGQLCPDVPSKVQKLGLACLNFHSQTLAGYCDMVSNLSQALEVPDKGHQLLADFQRAKLNCQERRRGWKISPRVAIEVSLEPLMFAGKGSYVEELLSLAGGVNACAGFPQPYPTLNLEQLLRLDPDVIILTDARLAQVQGRAGWSGLRAARRSLICEVDESSLVRPTPRLVLGLGHLQEVFERAISLKEKIES